jgi:signal transduction histidine kinase
MVTVTDDGTPTGTGAGAGRGLPGMKERARLLGGSVTADALPGQGFRVSGRLPL